MPSWLTFIKVRIMPHMMRLRAWSVSNSGIMPVQPNNTSRSLGFLCCFHGISTLTAITVITEIFEFGRFESPRHLMSYLGLTPSENSSSEKQKKGAITKTGNKHIRRLLNETQYNASITVANSRLRLTLF